MPASSLLHLATRAVAALEVIAECLKILTTQEWRVQDDRGEDTHYVLPMEG